MTLEITSLFFVNDASSHLALPATVNTTRHAIEKQTQCSIYNYSKCDGHALPLSAISCHGLT